MNRKIALLLLFLPLTAAFFAGPASAKPATTTTVPQPSTRILRQCGQTLTTGNYVVVANLTAPTGPCVTITGSGVTLDCQGHSLDVGSYGTPTATVADVTGFTITGCIFPGSSGNITTIQITRSSGTIQNTTCAGGQIHVESSSLLNISHDTFTSCTYAQYATTGTYIGLNTFSNPHQVPVAAFIVSAGGMSNTVDRNQIDGGSFTSAGYYNPNATDDGIVLGAYGYRQEDRDQITANTLRGFYDCGIETVGYVTNTTFLSNMITYANNCGIGAWYWDSWAANTVATNTVDYTDRLFAFYNMDGALDGTVVYFQSNQFTSNVLGTHNGYGLNLFLPASYFYMEAYEQPGVTYVTGQNVFTSNNFGDSRPTPVSVPAVMIVDGGGNVCMPSTVLACS